MSRTLAATERREATDERVLGALKAGPATRKQIAMDLGMSATGVWFCIERLVAEQRIKPAEGHTYKNGGRRGSSMLWEIDRSPEAQQRMVTKWSGAAFRHPMDVALFGEYRRAA